MKFNFNLNLKNSAFYLEKQKSFIQKPLSISKQKSFVYCLNFPKGFGQDSHTIAAALYFAKFR